MNYEYKVVPAPLRGLKAKGVKTAEDRFALALQTAMNDLAQDGWEYLRADTLPSEQREGLMSKTTVYQNMLVFRREKTAVTATAPAPSVKTAAQTPTIETPRPSPVVETKKLVATEKPAAQDTPKTPQTPDASSDVAAQ